MANEFVARKGVISLGGLTFPYYPTSVNYTVSPDDFFIDILLNDVTVELPNAIGIEGKQYAIRNTSTGDTTVSCFSTQTIEGDITITLGKGNTIQVVSDNTQWKISNVGGPIRTATNNSLLTSDGTIGGVNANTGLTFDGQTLKIEGQTSATTSVETYAYTLEGPFTVTGTTLLPENIVFSANTSDYIVLNCYGRTYISGGTTIQNHHLTYSKQPGITSLTVNQIGTARSTRLYLSSNTDTTICYLRNSTGSATTIVDEVNISVDIIKHY